MRHFRNGMGDGEDFVCHEACPKCGSRDNLARYGDGHGWCFGCNYYEPSTGHIAQIRASVKNNLVKPLPVDAQKSLPVKCWQWLSKYGIIGSEVEDFLWSESRQWMIMPLYDDKRMLLAWQARNFGPEGVKYLTFGQISDIIHIEGSGDIAVIVEDMLSAIKVGRVYAGIPIFGSSIPLKTLTRLSREFNNLVIWLDRDKAQESLKTKARASQMIFDNVISVITDKDPKEYSENEIKEKIWRPLNFVA